MTPITTTAELSAFCKSLKGQPFVADALKLKRGELALVLDGTRVRVVEVRRAPRAATPA